MPWFTQEEVEAFQAEALAALPESDARRYRWKGPFNAFDRGVAPAVFTRDRHTVLVSVMRRNGERWLHVSVSKHGGKLPDYDDMSEVSNCFIPPNLPAVEVWPPRAEHYSIAEVRHLWCRLDERCVPDLRLFDDTMGDRGI